MGFPFGHNGVILPKFLLTLLSLLTFTKYLFRPLRLSGLPEPDLIRLHGPGSDPIPASLIRVLLPPAKFSELAGPQTPENCAVCLHDFQPEEEIRRLRNCTHIFHRRCLDRWMEHDRVTCPLCRTPFVTMEMQQGFCNKSWAEYLHIPNFL